MLPPPPPTRFSPSRALSHPVLVLQFKESSIKFGQCSMSGAIRRTPSSASPLADKQISRGELLYRQASLNLTWQVDYCHCVETGGCSMCFQSIHAVDDAHHPNKQACFLEKEKQRDCAVPVQVCFVSPQGQKPSEAWAPRE